ncbi:hypothetical protein [Streptomyces celluloflavus]|uniref:hypothetical protein n=1 Tax=Streptomyces celluloflavus TaxID=58344 RepID=UPI0036954461
MASYDPEHRIAHLTELVERLLAAYEQQAGHPALEAEEIGAALREVAEIPQTERKQRARALITDRVANAARDRRAPRRGGR